MIAETLAAFAGVPARVQADRMACLKGGVVADVVVQTPDYVRLASNYGLQTCPFISESRRWWFNRTLSVVCASD